jgi:hypothetical protein
MELLRSAFQLGSLRGATPIGELFCEIIVVRGEHAFQFWGILTRQRHCEKPQNRIRNRFD